MELVTDEPESANDGPPRKVLCVGAVVLNETRVLLVHQAKGHDLAGQWTIPWGIVDALETPEAAAVRETREESGISASVEGLLGTQNLPQPGWVALIYLCRHVSGVPTPDGDIETDRAAYFTVDRLVQCEEPVEPLSGWLIRRILRGECQIIAPEPGNPFPPRLAFL